MQNNLAHNLQSLNHNEICESNNQIFNAKEAAEYIGISVWHLYALIREKKVPVLKMGRKIILRKSTIDQWLNQLEAESFQQ